MNVASRCCSSSSRPRLRRPGALLYASASTTICKVNTAVRSRLLRCCQVLPQPQLVKSISLPDAGLEAALLWRG